MKALTVRQPWASLIAAGVKTIETRSWRTAYRGRIAIHASKRTVPDAWCVPDLNATLREVFGWQPNPGYPPSCAWPIEVLSLPRGAVVATAELVDCVPMVGNGVDFGDPDALNVPWGFYGHEGRVPNLPLELCQRVDPHHYRVTDVSDQEPFGVFEPGRWAWLLDDIKHVNELCPWCWGDGVVEGEQEVRERMCLCEGGRGPHGEYPCSRCGGSAVILELLDPLMLCPVCAGDGACDPVPARGRQGLWNWEPEATHATPPKETQ